MWHEYIIPASYDGQKRIIRELRTWIEELEQRGYVTGYAFNHYYSVPPAPDYPDELRIRFEYANEGNSAEVEKELEAKIRLSIHDYTLRQRVWNNGTTPEYVLRAYEFGSRCAFLFWKLVETGRFEESLTSSFYPFQIANEESIRATNFQRSFSHGLMNSLGISKIPDELLIHISAIIEYSGASSVEELCTWLRNHRGDFEAFFHFLSG